MNELVTMQVKKEEEQFMNMIIQSKGSNLPASVEEVLSVFEFTDFKAKAWRIFASKTSKLSEQADIHQAAIRSGQQWGIAALYAQKRMGEITMEMPKGKPLHKKYQDSSSEGKETKMANVGISRDTYERAEDIARHPEILEKAIEEAKEKNEIPTRGGVLKKIFQHKQEEQNKWREQHNEEAREKQNKKRLNESDDQVKVYLESIKGFKSALDLAIVDATNGKYSPESKNFIVKKHNQLKELMTQLEELI